ncbi:MAG: Do family serine endopeptidase [Cyclobacteriaceae bacterium]|nr:Do family serine endopeptidase [Cyclobacteriaceae bacterium]MCB0500881.1 Do family serine endopeptidase [Cyclobacteriaceae bacterium]MCB9237848.1 Do family serine endopeptidase [Flammeovirgaceae bacterium]MCO5270050.1 Do family serine endopeptidase [Cyclobacteriaceae bacterium]MCW5902546.1 Do family serine endopeptidase [Cyclobacteriaceae bacterium]
MNKFFQLVIAAILGSGITMVANQWYGNDNKNVKIEHIDGVPATSVAYTVNENGEAVPLDFTGTADKVTPAVVYIRSTQERGVYRNSPDPLREFFNGPSPMQRGPAQSSGSGVIINKNGYIVTNNHVVQGADIVEVTLSDNSTYKAEVIGTDPDTDLAVIKVNQKDLPYLSFVDSDQSKVGQWVLAVGNPFNLNSTVTAGIISAKGRNINIINSNTRGENEQLGNTAIESFIQTDAAINPGNSGGALVSLDGGLLGINTAIASPTGAYSGYGFAVPSNIVSKVVEDLIAYGAVQRGWLGVTVQNVTSDLAKQEMLDRNEGAYIVDFAENSAAREAGLQKGDVVVQMDDSEIKSSTALIEYVGQRRPGDKIVIKVDRKGKIVEVPVTLKNKNGELATIRPKEKDAVASLGLSIEKVDQKVLNRLDLKGGVRVSKLENGKLSRYTDMREGFIITHIDDQAVNSVEEANRILKDKKEGDLVTFSGIYEDFPREYIYALRM